MADTKISALSALTAVAVDDFTVIVDKSDTTMAASGTDKKISVADLATQTINAQTGTTYTIVLTDVTKLVTLSNASAITLTLPQDSDVAVPIGARIDFAQIGAGQVTVAAGSGATVNSTPGLKFRAQYSMASAVKRAANTWILTGDLSA